MSVAPSCLHCGLEFVDDLAIEVNCPSCGTPRSDEPRRPAMIVGKHDPDELAALIRGGRPAPRRGGAAGPLLAFVVFASIAAACYWTLRPAGVGAGRASRPDDPDGRTAFDFVQALIDNDQEALARLGSTSVLPPRLAGLESLRAEPAGNLSRSGEFAPIAAFHEKLEADYRADPRADRYKAIRPPQLAASDHPAAPAAPAAEPGRRLTEEELFEVMGGDDPMAAEDAARALFDDQPVDPFEQAPGRPPAVEPTYAQLAEAAEPRLEGEARALALDYGIDRVTWDALIGRPFPKLRDAGPFELERREWIATVRRQTEAGPARSERLRLVVSRFRLGGLDSGWKVTSAALVGADGPGQAP